MNAPLSPEQIAAMQVHSVDLLQYLVMKEVEPKRRGPWSKGDEGRKRRSVRRNRIRAKAAWLYE